MFNIQFHTYEHYRGVIPEPKPASHFIPKWYKDMPVQTDKEAATSGTMKRCIPVRDMMTAGYIIPLWADAELKPGAEDISYGSNPMFEKPVLSSHGEEQVHGCPHVDSYEYGHMPLKFESPWIVTTPLGYSCIFMAPFYFNEERFQILPAIVDTDVYYNHINFPFLWDSNKYALLEKGLPLVQVIPFRRHDWESSISYGDIDAQKHHKTKNGLGSYMKNAYKLMFWKRKKYT